MARHSVLATPCAAPFLPNGTRFPSILALLACLAFAAPAALAQADTPPQEFGDGIWPGDEGDWDTVVTDDEERPDEGDEAGDEADPPEGESQPDNEGEQVNAGPTIDDFKEALTPYGTWVTLPTYGFVWQPVGLGAAFRPYSQGQWVWTAFGWTWLSEEPWGWAPYHYGRWIWAGASWYWAPGRIWGPAWVSWRWGGGAAGWCPLGWGGRRYRHGPAWVFVDSRHFLDPVHQHAIPLAQTDNYYGRARRLPHARPGPHSGPPPRGVGHDTGRTINPVPTSDTGHPVNATTGKVFNGGRIQVYRPHTRPIVWAHPAPVVRPGAPKDPADHGGKVGKAPARPPGWGGVPGRIPPHFGGVPARGILDKNRPPNAPGRGGGAPKLLPPPPGLHPRPLPPGPVSAPKGHARPGGKAEK